jgi:hypothetical protein
MLIGGQLLHPNLGISLSLPGQEKEAKGVLTSVGGFCYYVLLLNLQLEASVFAFVVKCQ